jgi:hypothetical protein
LPWISDRTATRALAVTATAAVFAAATARMPSARVAGRVFPATFMPRVAYGAMRIMGLVGVKMIKRLFPMVWKRTVVAVVRVVPVVDVAIPSVGAVIPGARADENSASEPIRTIEAIGCAIIGSIVKVAIRAYRGHPYVDGNLRWRT